MTRFIARHPHYATRRNIAEQRLLPRRQFSPDPKVCRRPLKTFPILNNNRARNTRRPPTLTFAFPPIRVNYLLHIIVHVIKDPLEWRDPGHSILLRSVISLPPPSLQISLSLSTPPPFCDTPRAWGSSDIPFFRRYECQLPAGLGLFGALRIFADHIGSTSPAGRATAAITSFTERFQKKLADGSLPAQRPPLHAFINLSVPPPCLAYSPRSKPQNRPAFAQTSPGLAQFRHRAGELAQGKYLPGIQ